MFRTIITPDRTSLTIELPQELVGKPVEVLAFEIENGNEKLNKKENWEKAVAFWDSCAVDMSDFKFDREEANER